MEESLSFEEFYYSGFSSEQNAGILRRILKNEHFAHLLPKEKIEQITTKKQLKDVYSKILQRTNYQRPDNLIITDEKRIEAETTLAEKAEKKNKIY